MEWYRPAAVVLQCGGDSLSGDKLGCFNLSMKGKATRQTLSIIQLLIILHSRSC